MEAVVNPKMVYLAQKKIGGSSWPKTGLLSQKKMEAVVDQKNSLLSQKKNWRQ